MESQKIELQNSENRKRRKRIGEKRKQIPGALVALHFIGSSSQPA